MLLRTTAGLLVLAVAVTACGGAPTAAPSPSPEPVADSPSPAASAPASSPARPGEAGDATASVCGNARTAVDLRAAGEDDRAEEAEHLVLQEASSSVEVSPELSLLALMGGADPEETVARMLEWCEENAVTAGE